MRKISNVYSNSSHKPLVFIIAGPTASGKTALGIELAKAFDGEIVSADSMQIYKGLPITTAAPTKEETAEIPHHLIGVIDPTVNFSVADFVPLANTAIADIVSRGKQPIIVGGTGLYIKSLRDGIDFSTDSADHAVRERLLREADSINKEGENSVYFPNSSVKSNAGTSTNSIHPHDSNALSPDKNPVPLGNMVMWRRLLALDPESAALIPPQNITRVIRALEISETTGIPFSDYKRAQVRGNADYDFRGVFLDFADRAKLYDRINRRVDAMMKAGMVDECEKAYRSGTFTGTTVSQAIGYKELIPYFNGETDLQTVTETIKQSTRRYAKRQLTWFRHDNALFHVEIPNNDNLNNSAEKNFKIIYEFFSKQ